MRNVTWLAVGAALAVVFAAGCEDDKTSSDDPADTTPVGDTATPADTADTVANDTAADTAMDTWANAQPGPIGAPCRTADDCEGDTCLGQPGGYCAVSGCSDAKPCPGGATCFTFQNGTGYCLQNCGHSSECRPDEGYICDVDATCWPAYNGNAPIGGPCRGDSDCGDDEATCYGEGFDGNANGFIGGYCLQFECQRGQCPDGSACVQISGDGSMGCMADCSGGAACPQQGYQCSSTNTCWPGCDSDADCPDEYGCHEEIGGCVFGWSSEPFVCEDQRYEPNETIGAPAEIAAPLSEEGHHLCSGDEDWFETSFAAGQLGTVGITFSHLRGDLDLLAYDEGGELLGSRLGPFDTYGAQYRANENRYEYHSILGMKQDVTGFFRVRGFQGAQNAYDLEVTSTEWVDDLLCTDHFAFDACRGWNGTAGGEVYQFPFPRADDPYVPNGYSLESYSQYRWLRRETIMLVRSAIHEVQQRFRKTDPLGLIDMGDKDGVTPGYDVGDPRHPESTHDQGGNIDIAYYQTDGDSSGDVVCGPNGSAHDGYFCTSVDKTVMDAERQAYFMAMLNRHPRVRVIGVDKLLAPLIEVELRRQRDEGIITAELANRTIQKMAYGDGWPFHHHHIHLSMRWWSQDDPQPSGLVVHPEPLVGCGYRMPGDGPPLKP